MYGMVFSNADSYLAIINEIVVHNNTIIISQIISWHLHIGRTYTYTYKYKYEIISFEK